MSRLRPGASEVFDLLVPCELVAEQGHTISIRLRDDNRVTFEKLCDRKVAAAVDLLNGRKFVSCYNTAALLANSILDHHDRADIQVCETCIAYVALGPLARRCPIAIRKHDAPQHRLRAPSIPWWERIVRVGRVRRP